jgi:hypothetical protein
VLGLCLVWPVWGCIGRGLQLADQLPRACTEFAWLELLGSATAAGQFVGECEAARAMLLGPALAEARLQLAGYRWPAAAGPRPGTAVAGCRCAPWPWFLRPRARPRVRGWGLVPRGLLAAAAE